MCSKMIEAKEIWWRYWGKQGYNYFLQLCGYDGEDLRQCILVDHKADFMRDANGEENDERYGLVKVLLSYITSDTVGINDGIHYTDEFLDEKVYRDTFEMIFRCMGQSQHFDMMMGNSYCGLPPDD